MTQGQINTFNKLLEDPDFKGKDQLRHLLWLNTSKPKFKKGECFIVTDSSHRIYGNFVKNFHATILQAYSYKDTERWYYELEMQIEYDGKVTTSKVYQSENELTRAKRCDDNINILCEKKSEVREEQDV